MLYRFQPNEPLFTKHKHKSVLKSTGIFLAACIMALIIVKSNAAVLGIFYFLYGVLWVIIGMCILFIAILLIFRQQLTENDVSEYIEIYTDRLRCQQVSRVVSQHQKCDKCEIFYEEICRSNIIYRNNIALEIIISSNPARKSTISNASGNPHVFRISLGHYPKETFRIISGEMKNELKIRTGNT